MNNLQNNVAFRKENLSHPPDNHFERFKYIFVGNPLGYIYMHFQKKWQSLKNPPEDWFIHYHLDRELWGGSRYQTHTRSATLDFDDKLLDEVLRICSLIGVTPSISMLCTSISINSWHLHLPLSLYGPPVPISRLQRAFKPYTRKGLFEVFPQPNQGCRWPFGMFQKPIDQGCRYLDSWEDQLDYFCNLKPYNLVIPAYDQTELNLGQDKPGAHHRSHVTPVLCDLPSVTKSRPYTFNHSNKEALWLLEKGLPGPGTRNKATFALFLHYRKQRVSLNEAIRLVCEWIRHKHNNFSKEYPHNPRRVFNHIKDQGKRVYKHFDENGISPYDANCSKFEYITKSDIFKILSNCNHNWPTAKFLSGIVIYYSSRNHRVLVRINCREFKKLSSINFYKKRLDELESQGLAVRGSDYRKYHYPKFLILNWEYGNFYDAVYFNGRLARTLEEAIVASYTPGEARKLLRDTGFPRKNSERIIRTIYNKLGTKRRHTI